MRTLDTETITLAELADAISEVEPTSPFPLTKEQKDALRSMAVDIGGRLMMKLMKAKPKRWHKGYIEEFYARCGLDEK